MIIVLCACPTSTVADTIATALVERRLAACVSSIPGIVSTYRWKDTIHSESEYLLLIKTIPDHFEAIKTHILELHPYELPEIITVDVSSGLDRYLSWVRQETRSDK